MQLDCFYRLVGMESLFSLERDIIHIWDEIQ